MNFLGALATGIEDAIGRPANSMAYVAGKRLGKKLSRNAPKTDDIEKALDAVRKVLASNSCLWHFETVIPEDRKNLIEKTEDGDEVLIVFRDCMIRQALFSFGHHQKGSLCNMMYGFFSGALENITGCKSQLQIMHAGENACLKRLTLDRDG
jgi:predicted hydrocarbon binding protein